MNKKNLELRIKEIKKEMKAYEKNSADYNYLNECIMKLRIEIKFIK